MKKILIISPTGGYAGVDACLDNLVSKMDKKRFDLTVVFPEDALLKDKFESMEGVKCYALPLKWWFPIGVCGKDLPLLFAENKSNIDALEGIIRDEGIELVLSNTTVSLDGCIASAICRIPHIFFMHARFVDNIYTNMLPQTKRMIYRLMSASSTKIVCCSEALARQMKEYIQNVTYINNGIDVSKFSFMQKHLDNEKETRLNIVMVGHFNENKRHDFVIRALKIIKDQRGSVITRIHYTAIGPGEDAYISRLKSMIIEYGLEHYITFESFAKNIADRLKEFNLYVNSSITETLSLSVMEAMSCGLPVVATPTDSARLIIEEGKNGFICDTPQQMADRFCEFLEDESLMETMSRNARKRIENHFSVDNFVRKFEELFDLAFMQKEVVDERNCQNIVDLYNTLTISPQKISILIVYPKAAMATFILAAKKPLEYLMKSKIISIVCKDLPEVENSDIEMADIVYCIRYYHDEAHRLLQRTRAKGKGFVWYIDDNYNAVSFNNGEVIYQESHNDLYEWMFEKSDYVIVNNRQILNLGKKYTDKIVCLPTYQEVTHTEYKKCKPENVIRFGFMGTLNRDGDFDCVVEAINKILDKFGSQVEVEFIGYYPPMLKKREQIHHFKFINDYDEFRAFFEGREWDFALAPLSDTQFNRSKTNNKYREYSSYALPAIFSNISTYADYVRDQENGLLVDNNAEDWYCAMEKLIQSKELRRKLGETAQKDIQENYNIKKFAEPLFSIFEKVMQGVDRGNIPNSIKSIREGTDLIPVQKNYDWYYHFRRTDIREMIKQINPLLWGTMSAYISNLGKKPCCLSEPIPFTSYIEYTIKGIGEDINFILVGRSDSKCIVEIVEEGKIVYNCLLQVLGWQGEIVSLGNIRGKLNIRFQANSAKDIVRVAEVIDRRFILLGQRKLCGWIS